MNLKDYVQAERGRLKSLSDVLEKSSAYLSHLCSGRKPVPPALCIAIERATYGAVTRYELRPHDGHLIWPPAERRCADCPHGVASERDCRDG